MSQNDGLEHVGGLWVPAPEKEFFQATPLTSDGILDLDVTKVREAARHCVTTDVALDVGAHVGATAVAMSKIFNRVLAFEPVPAVFAALAKNAEKIHNIECHPVGIGRERGALFFEYMPRHSQLSHVLRDGEKPSFNKSIVVGPVPSVPIDDLQIANVSLIKVDVEGAELDALEGARLTILRCRPMILVEQRGNEAKFHGGVRDEGAAFLEGLGMKRTPFVYRNDHLYRFPPLPA